MTISTENDEKEKRRLRRLARKEREKGKNEIDVLTKKGSESKDKIEFGFDLSFDQYLKSYISEYIRRSGYVKLNFQEKIIFDNVETFFHNFLYSSIKNIFHEDSINSKQEKINKWILEKFNLKGSNETFEEGQNKLQNENVRYNGFLNVINVDVGLGKTLMSVVSTLTIIKGIQYLHNVLYGMSFKKDGLFDCEEFNSITNLKKKKTDGIQNIFDVKINIICKKSLSKEFEYTIQKFGEKINYEFLYNGISKVGYDFDNNFLLSNELSTLSYLAQMLYYDQVFDENNEEHQEEIMLSVGLFHSDGVLGTTEGEKFRGLTENSDEGKIDLAKSIGFFIIDEFGTDQFFFGNGQNAQKKKYLGKIFGIGLTASKVENQSYLSQCSSKFVSKKDVLKELIEQGMYKENGFLYKNLIDESEEYEEIVKNLKELVSQYKILSNKTIVDGRNAIKLMIESINSFLKNDDQSVEEFLTNINTLKQAYDSQYGKSMGSGERERLKNLIDSFEDMKEKKLKEFYKEKIFNKLLRFDLLYLFEKNTIFVFDKEFTNDQIKEFREKVKQEGLNLVTLDTYQDMKGVGNVLIGSIHELSKGLNLQNFDNLLFLYVNQFTFDDIHQTIGRIDRIGSINDKEIVFLSFIKNKELVDKIIEKRKEISNKFSIEKYLIQDGNKIEGIDEYSKDLENAKNLFNQLFKDSKDKNSGFNKEKLELLNENKEMIKEMIKDMTEQLECYNEASSLIYGGRLEDELELITNIIGIAK